MPRDKFSTERGRRLERQKLAIMRAFLRNLGTRDTQRLMSSPSALAQPENDTAIFSGANVSIWVACRFVGGRDASPKTHCLPRHAKPCLCRSRRDHAWLVSLQRPSSTECVRSSPTTRTFSLSPHSDSIAGMLSS
jgi:hypothetical protein